MWNVGTVSTGDGKIENKGEKQCDGEEERGSGGGEEARGSRHLPSLCSICVSDARQPF